MRSKRQRLDNVTPAHGIRLPAPGSAAVGPVHLVRQHGQKHMLPSDPQPRLAGPQVGSTGALPIVSTIGPQALRQAAVSKPHAEAPPPAAATVSRAAQPAPAQPRSSADQPPLVVAKPPHRTLASLAREGRLAAQRDGAGANPTQPEQAADAVAVASDATALAQQQLAPQQTAPPPLAGGDAAAKLHNSASGTTAFAQDGTVVKGAVASFLQRLKVELPPAAHDAVTAHLAEYR